MEARVEHKNVTVTVSGQNDDVPPSTDHYDPTVRQLTIPKLENGSCGFNLSRSKWDPYPWVSSVEKESPAEVTGLKVGDCILEVNGEDVLGLRIMEVAALVKMRRDCVLILAWSTGFNLACDPESLCCGPMPLSLERLSASMQAILSALECPVCMDTIPPPAIQCLNGHLVCAKCRMRAERCPVCREKYSPGRSLIGEQVYNSITNAFNLRESVDGKLREKLFGAKCIKSTATKEIGFKSVQSHTHKFLARLMGKATSLDNLSNKKECTVDDLQMLKLKAISMSATEVNGIHSSAPNTRSPSPNHLTPDWAGSQTFLGTRRPRSTHASNESLNSLTTHSGLQLVVPPLDDVRFSCPSGEECDCKLLALELSRHLTEQHNIPVICFGTSSAEISVPPKAPITNAALILVLDNKSFWFKLNYVDGSYHMQALYQGAECDAAKYYLEVNIRNVTGEKLLAKELVARNAVYSLLKMSLKDVQVQCKTVCLTNESISSTFGEDEELILSASIKRVADM